MNEISTCQNTHTWSKDRGSNETIYISLIEQQTKNRLNHFSILNNNKTKLWWAQHHPMCLLVVTLWIIHLSNLTFLMRRDQAIQTSSQRHCYPGFCPPNYSNYFAEEILINLLEAPALFPSPRPMFTASGDPSSFIKSLLDALGGTKEVDGIDALFILCLSSGLSAVKFRENDDPNCIWVSGRATLFDPLWSATSAE